MNLSQRVGRNAAGQIGGRLFTSALAFVITALLLPRQLSESDFGVFAFHLTLYQLLTNVLDFGAGTIVVREASRDREAAGRLIGMLVRLKALIGLAGTVLLIVVALLFEGTGTRFLLLALAALHLMFHAPGGASAIFAVDMAFGRLVVAGILGQLAWLGGTLGLAIAGVHAPAPYLVAFGLGPLVTGTLGYLWARRRVTIRYDAPPEDRRRLWSDAWPAGVSMTMASVYFYIDTIMLRPLVDEVGVAHYSAAYRLMGFVLMVPVLFSQVIFPVFSRLWARGAERLDPFFQRCTVVLASVGVLFPATVPWVAADAMAVVYPPEYAPGAESLAVLSLAIVLVYAAYPHVNLLLAAGHQKVMMKVSIAGVVLNIALNLALVPRMGIVGAAWTTVATEAFVVVAAAVAGARLTGVRFRLSAMSRAALSATGASLTLFVLRDHIDGAGLRLLVGVGVAAVGLALSGAFPLSLGSDDGGAAR